MATRLNSHGLDNIYPLERGPNRTLFTWDRSFLLNDIVATDSIIVATGGEQSSLNASLISGVIITSRNGHSWKKHLIPQSYYGAGSSGIATDGQGNWVVVAWDGYLGPTSTGIYYSKDNAVTWRAAQTDVPQNRVFRGVVYDSVFDKYIAYGSSGIMYVSDRVDTWKTATRVAMPTTMIVSPGVTWKGLAVGAVPLSLQRIAMVVGVDVNGATTGTVGGGIVMKSTDLINWTEVTIPSVTINGILYSSDNIGWSTIAHNGMFFHGRSPTNQGFVTQNTNSISYLPAMSTADSSPINRVYWDSANHKWLSVGNYQNVQVNANNNPGTGTWQTVDGYRELTKWELNLYGSTYFKSSNYSCGSIKIDNKTRGAILVWK
jgi:hypothetical protein